MARKSSWNPIAFVPAQVTIISSIVYIALFAVLTWVHHTVPSAPSKAIPVAGVNLTQAWLDLSYISDGFHPIDSRRNEAVRDYLLEKISVILDTNGVEHKVVKGGARVGAEKEKNSTGSKDVTVFEDNSSNVTFVDDFRKVPWTCYGESTNILVYIRGKDDKNGDWWESNEQYDGQGGVLVNAHYDSVSSGYGATDDGVGVVTILQLISYFTTKGNRPKRGVVALLNNGEENGLYGAHNYLRHPLSQFTHTFLNLEGAGAGGKATLFRSTDAEVTKFYAKSPRPYGTVVSGDGFKRGFIRSGTDYTVFNGDNGMRGLDVAFFEPRARYHTDQDDAKDTSPASLWHMLSSSLATMQAMTSYSGDEFEGQTRKTGSVDIGKGTDGVWFDLFGRVFAVMKLPTLFAVSIVLLTAPPLVLIALHLILERSDKWYPLSKRQYLDPENEDTAVHFSGMRGLLRFPISFIAATAAVLALAYLVAKINPFVVYSSEYAVWTMMLSAWFCVGWFFLAGADRVRPTALQRMYILIWLYSLSWAILAIVTVGENNFQIASGYCMLIYNASAFVALLIAYLELFALPTKKAYIEHAASAGEEQERQSTRRASPSSRSRLSEQRPPRSSQAGDDEDATESTSLLRSGDRRRLSEDTFTRFGRRRQPDNDGGLEDTDDKLLTKAYGDEQAWSSSLPRWTWIVQFILLAPINVIVLGQISLILTAGLQQTPADGNPVLPIYLIVAALATLLLLPLTPFLHRFSYKVPTILFFIFIGCLVYNLIAFPFSRDARLKIFFVQQVDLNSGANNVTLIGLDGFVQDVISGLPSAAGEDVRCGDRNADNLRAGLQSCVWSGLAPNVLANEVTSQHAANHSEESGYDTWLDYNITSTNSSASFSVRGRNTKSCRLEFNKPVSEVHIEDAASDPRYRPVAEKGSTQVRLFSRDWDKNFSVNVTWAGQNATSHTGRVVCMWSDANQFGTIPAFDEVRRFGPVWSAVTKTSDGLVEGYKDFEVM
ncbi:hypothetical protein LTR37_012952 [Vermiconidia calcicola]|uniref:Uncharacterized protein n=1 Tax=Vermiconidia calcicola TaxID=1690605 RepID=A0ACC3MYL5_9PEZI|nr:hypothetical protein LTR37_012952 [Vermiconidia calcicola]